MRLLPRRVCIGAAAGARDRPSEGTDSDDRGPLRSPVLERGVVEALLERLDAVLARELALRLGGRPRPAPRARGRAGTASRRGTRRTPSRKDASSGFVS